MTKNCAALEISAICGLSRPFGSSKEFGEIRKVIHLIDRTFKVSNHSILTYVTIDRTKCVLTIYSSDVESAEADLEDVFAEMPDFLEEIVVTDGVCEACLAEAKAEQSHSFRDNSAFDHLPTPAPRTFWQIGVQLVVWLKHKLIGLFKS